MNQSEKNDMNWCFDFHNWISSYYDEHRGADGKIKYWTWKGSKEDKKKYTKTHVYKHFVESH